jgi:SPP1 gp7 family putative phage head morphogenesis protein
MPTIDPEILKIAFKLPPEKAVEFLKKKGFVFTMRWQDALASAHDTAFTVAKVMRMDVLVAIRQMVERAQTDGLSFDRFRRSLEPYLKLAGWWGRGFPTDEQGRLLDEKGNPFPADETGEQAIPDDAKPVQLGSPTRLSTIYQTNLQVSYMAGRRAGQLAAVEQLPYWQYISVMDDRTTYTCSALHLKIYRADDPFWKTFYPPNHWRCRARVRALTQAQVDRRNFMVSDSAGLLGSEDVLISKKTGETGSASTVKIGDVVYRNDPAFNSAPGSRAWQPDLSIYPKELVKQVKKEKG